MSGTLETVNASSDTFASWLTKTNAVINAFNTLALTFPNSSTVSIGGILTYGIQVGANVSIGTSALFLGNTSVNTIITSAGLTTNVATLGSTLAVGANVSVNTSILKIGNTSVNTTVNSSVVATPSGNFSSNVKVGANVLLTTDTLLIGNSSINVVINSSSISIGSLTLNSSVSIENANNSAYLGGLAPSAYAKLANTNTFAANTTFGGVVTTFSSNVEINGANTNFSGYLRVANNATVNGSLVVDGDLTVSGNTTFNSTGQGNLIPASNSYSLGNNTNRWLTYATYGFFSSDLTVAGNMIANGVLTIQSGTSGAPAIGFTGDAATGIFRPAGNQLAIALGGLTRYTFTGNSFSVVNSISIGNNATITNNLTVDGTATLNNIIASTSMLINGSLSVNNAIAISGNATVNGNIGIGQSPIAGVGLISTKTTNNSIIVKSTAADYAGFIADSVYPFVAFNTASVESARISASSDTLVFYTGNTTAEKLRLTNTGRLGLNNNAPAVALHITATDSVLLPVGTTLQRPTGAVGYIRYNSDLAVFEGYQGSVPAWVGIAPLASPTFTGTPAAPTPANTDNSTRIATTAFVNAVVASVGAPNLASYALIDSQTFTGTPRAPNPVGNTHSNTQIATTAWVQNVVTASLGGGSYAPLNSPTFTGTPAAPTALAGTSTTQIATTAFVATAISGNVANYAPLASPGLTGSPTSPTPTGTDNSTKIATTAFVRSAITTYSPVTSVNGGTGAVSVTASSIGAINTTSGTMSTDLRIGSTGTSNSVYLTTASIRIGNSSVNCTINSTAISGSLLINANNSNYVGGKLGSDVVSRIDNSISFTGNTSFAGSNGIFSSTSAGFKVGNAQFAWNSGTGGGSLNFSSTTSMYFQSGNSVIDFATNGGLRLSLGGGGAVFAVGASGPSFTPTSDGRLKENVNSIDASADIIMAMRPVSYFWSNNVPWEDKYNKQVGFIAQELLEVDADLVYVPNDPETQYYGLNTTAIIARLTKALQETIEKTRELEARLNAYETSAT